MRVEGDFIKINEWLLPLSWLYGLGVKFRNMLFEIGILHSESFDVPVISVGNITVGGTGKTPHVEYLIELLKDKAKVAVLSRGYKRRTRGFVIADDNATAKTIGDEPLQMKRKYGDDITVAVDRKRCHGIRQLISDEDGIDVILLDDAFQHRYVKPGVNILLVDYHRLIIYDKLLPAGRLREPLSGKNRADIVIVTKCPHDLKPMEFRVITKAMNLYPFQRLFFTCLEYRNITPVFGSGEQSLDSIDKDCHILLLTGIASPQQMIEDLSPRCQHITPLTFGDHHTFTSSDVARINNEFAALPHPKMIITTEKDATRLIAVEGLSEEVRGAMFALPVKIRFMLGQEESFNEKIIGYVRKNSRNSILAKAKDDNKSRNGNNLRDRSRTISFRNN
ncbi:MAG: tetraacyldisaccharide 4'-kinase [Prevotellaceae bacterium]|nr:tetraacyldisaccharide 4'-kinase [Prevotellaceae bacterium]